MNIAIYCNTEDPKPPNNSHCPRICTSSFFDSTICFPRTYDPSYGPMSLNSCDHTCPRHAPENQLMLGKHMFLPSFTILRQYSRPGLHSSHITMSTTSHKHFKRKPFNTFMTILYLSAATVTSCFPSFLTFVYFLFTNYNKAPPRLAQITNSQDNKNRDQFIRPFFNQSSPSESREWAFKCSVDNRLLRVVTSNPICSTLSLSSRPFTKYFLVLIFYLTMLSSTLPFTECCTRRFTMPNLNNNTLSNAIVELLNDKLFPNNHQHHHDHVQRDSQTLRPTSTNPKLFINNLINNTRRQQLPFRGKSERAFNITTIKPTHSPPASPLTTTTTKTTSRSPATSWTHPSNLSTVVRCNSTINNSCGPNAFCGSGICLCEFGYDGHDCIHKGVEYKETVVKASLSGGILVCLLAVCSVVFGIYLLIQRKKRSTTRQKLINVSNRKMRILLDALYEPEMVYKPSVVVFQPYKEVKDNTYNSSNNYALSNYENYGDVGSKVCDCNPILKTLNQISCPNCYVTSLTNLKSKCSLTHTYQLCREAPTTTTTDNHYHQLLLETSSLPTKKQLPTSRASGAFNDVQTEIEESLVKPYMYFDFSHRLSLQTSTVATTNPPPNNSSIPQNNQQSQPAFRDRSLKFFNSSLDDLTRFLPASNDDALLLAKNVARNYSTCGSNKHGVTDSLVNNTSNDNTSGNQPFQASFEELLLSISRLAYRHPKK